MARSEVSYTYDADLDFRAPGSAAVTATAEIGTLALDKMSNARSGDQKNKLGAEGYAVVIVVEALDLADADETYTFNVEVTGGGGSPAATAGALAVVGTGQYVIKLDGHTLEKISAAADRDELALNLVVAGTSPSITFSAWLAYDRLN